MNKLFSKGTKKKGFRVDENFENRSIILINKPDVNVLDDEKVMVDFNTGKYYVVKGVGNDIWDMIYDGVKVGAIVNRLLNIYEVDRRECVEKTAQFLYQLVEYGFIKLR